MAIPLRSRSMAKAFGFLSLYTIYRKPRDHPDHWVVRPTYLIRGEIAPVADPVACLCESLEEAREQVPLYINSSIRANLGREAGDDPVIVETWV